MLECLEKSLAKKEDINILNLNAMENVIGFYWKYGMEIPWIWIHPDENPVIVYFSWQSWQNSILLIDL